MKYLKYLLTFLMFVLLLNVKAQTPEELAAAQKEYIKMMSSLLNCDTLEKTLAIQYKTLKENGLSTEQLKQIKNNFDEQVKNCRNGYTQSESANLPPSAPNPSEINEIEIRNPEGQKPPFNNISIPNAYKITYKITDGTEHTMVDIYLAANSANYALVTKDPETGEDFYSIFKADTKKMYLIGKGTLVEYDFQKFQQSNQSLIPTKEEIAKFKMKPSGAVQTIAGYNCKELIGKTDDGSTFNIWIAYTIKSGSNVLPGIAYKETEKPLYKQLYGSDENGFFLKANTTSNGGTDSATATAIQKNPPQQIISTSGLQYFNGNNLLNMLKPSSK